MPFAAISYKVRPGHDEEITKIFSAGSFRRVESPALRDESGQVVGRLMATGLFIQDDLMVRVIQYEGDLAAVGRTMSAAPGVRAAEAQLAPYLAVPRENTPEGFKAHFRASSMRSIQQRVLEDRPATGLAALRYRIKPGHEDEIAAVFADVQRDARPTLRDASGAETGVILAVALFVRDDTMIRVVQFEGELDDVARYMAKRGPRPEIEAKLAPFMAEERHVETAEDFLTQFRSNAMQCISQLSVIDTPVGQ
jgi:SchA/CurD like domain-containing protein